jgi:signal transduction histidine kinase
VSAEVLLQLEMELLERKVHLSIQKPLPNVYANASTLTQVLVNLLSNAIKFVAPGISPEITIRTEQQNKEIRLWVEDNGIGIDSRDQDRIFKIFERLHGIETYPGTGIGLAIVRKAVERMNGRCGVISSLDKGSRFWIELPEAQEFKD